MNAIAAGIHQARLVSRREWCAIAGGLIGGFMAILDIQIATSSMKVIQGALAATLDDSSWLMTAYFTAEIVAIPLCGWLCQALGTGRYALWCIAGFLAASLLCAVAWNLRSMIVFRTLQGFSGGALIPISFRLIIEIMPAEKRPLGMSLFSIVGTFAPALRPALGGWLTDALSWHALFYLNLLPGLVAWALICRALPHPTIDWQVIRRGDVLGIVAVMLCLGALEIVLEKGGEENWLASRMICLLVVVAVLSAGLFLYAQLTHPQPLIAIRLLRDRHFACALLVFAMLGVAIYGTLFLVPYYLTRVHHYAAADIGTVTLWMGLPQLLILPFIPRLIGRVPLAWLIAFEFMVMAGSALMDCTMDGDFAGPQMAWSMGVRALGQPFIMVPLSLLAMHTVRQQDSASAAALINICRSLGGACGTAILSTAFIARIHLHIDAIETSLVSGSPAFAAFLQLVNSLLIERGLPADALHTHSLAVALVSKQLVRQAEIMAFNDLFFILGGMMLATALLVMLMSRRASLPTIYETQK